MKVFCFLAILAVAVSAAPFDESFEGPMPGVNGWHVPKVGGGFEWYSNSDLQKKAEQSFVIEGRAESNPVLFYLYTNAGPNTAYQILPTQNSIFPFNPNNPTRIIAHGWSDSYLSPLNVAIRDAWFTQGDFNIICIDWSRARSIDYIASAHAVPGVGQQVAAMIDYLHNNNGLRLESLIVIGHSLGAHVAGFTGKNLQSGQLPIIIGLDPAEPLFSYSDCDARLCNTDAAYVESIQTSGGKLGYVKPIGTGAFYPNGGKDQPGCGIDLDGACSHGRSWQYYAEAVKMNDFPAYQCPDYQDAVASEPCGGTYSSVRMGAMENAYKVAGDFYVPVNSASPYGMY